MAAAAEPRRRGRPPRLSVDERREALLDATRALFAAAGRGGTSVDAVAARRRRASHIWNASGATAVGHR